MFNGQEEEDRWLRRLKGNFREGGVNKGRVASRKPQGGRMFLEVEGE